MAYEYLYPKREKLLNKPFRAPDIMKLVEEADLKPLHIKVDNMVGQIIIYFEAPLSAKEKRKLDEVIEKLFKEW